MFVTSDIHTVLVYVHTDMNLVDAEMSLTNALPLPQPRLQRQCLQIPRAQQQEQSHTKQHLASDTAEE